MPSPASLALVETRGDVWSLVVKLKDQTTGNPINITGRTYRMQVRASSESTSITATYTCTVTDAANGTISCTCPSSTTTNVKPGDYVWDFEQMVSGSSPKTILSGTLVCKGDVTK